MRRSNTSGALKVSLKLAVQRLRSTTAKMEAKNKVARREIASLLEKGKEETARVRVESIIAEEISIELQEVLELYCELCIARIGLIEQSREVDPSIHEAVSGILYASPKTGLKELHSVTNHLLQQFGREYVVKCMDNVEDCVPARITSKLNTKTPEPSLVDQYLTVIAESYGISWSAQGGHPEVDDQSLDDLSLAERESISSIPEAPPLDPKQNDKTIAIHTSHLPSKATTNAPAAAAADDPSESSVKKPTPPTVNTTLPPAPSKSKADADFDALQKRFDALKKR